MGEFWGISGELMEFVRKIQGPMGNRGLKIPRDLSWQAHGS
jgi:hypothetical protein